MSFTDSSALVSALHSAVQVPTSPEEHEVILYTHGHTQFFWKGTVLTSDMWWISCPYPKCTTDPEVLQIFKQQSCKVSLTAVKYFLM